MSRYTTASASENPPHLPPRPDWASGLRRKPATIHTSHSRRPSALGQGIKRRVSSSSLLTPCSKRHGQALTLGTIDDIPPSISPSAAAVRPVDGVKFFGSVAVHNGGSAESDPAKSPVTTRPPPLSAPSASSSQTSSPVPKLDKKSIAKLFQLPSQFVATPPPEAASSASWSASLSSQAGQGQPYQPPFPAGALRQPELQNYQPYVPLRQSQIHHYPMPNGQFDIVGVSGRPQAGSGGPSADPAPTALPSQRLTPHPPPGSPSGMPPPSVWSGYQYHPSFVPGVPPPDQYYPPPWPSHRHFVPPQRQSPPPQHAPGSAPSSSGLPMSPRNPPLPLQQVPGTPTQSHAIPPILHPPHPLAPHSAPSVTSPPLTPLTTNRSTSLSTGKPERHIPANLAAEIRGVRVSDHVHAPCTDLNENSAPPYPTQEHIPTSPLKTPPDKLHPTLSSWIKNMNKLSSLIDRLKELAFSAPAEHRAQLEGQVVTMSETFKRQQERCIEFLQLSEEYASSYLLDISGEIQQQSAFLETLEKRLDMAMMLRGQAVALRKSHESGTVATMKEVRETALSRPLPEDFDLFSEVDFVLAEIRRCYEELDKFWTEEIRRAVKALEMRRVDLKDFERWKNFHASIKQAIEYSKTGQSRCDTQIIRHKNDTHSSTGEDIGTTVFSLLPAMDSLKDALKRIRSSASLEHVSHLGTSLALRLELAYAENRDTCLDFLQRCVQYAEIMTCPLHIAGPVSSHARSLRDLREYAMRSRFEATDISAESAVHAQGSRKFKASYEKALCLQQKTTLRLKTLLESVSPYVAITDGIPGDVPPGVVMLQELDELSYAWAEARDSVRAALVTLTSEPANRLYYRSAPLDLTRGRSGIRRWMTNLICFL